MSCQQEAHGTHGHGHSHGGAGGHGHSHSHEPEDASGQSLYGFIDRDRIVCYNEREENTGKNCIKPWDERLTDEPFVESDEDDPQLLFNIPFSVAVRIKSFCIVGGPNGTSPSQIKLFVNREDMDFSTAEDLPATQEIDLHEDFSAEIDYPLKVHKFQNVTSITMFITNSINEESTHVSYIGFKGESTGARRGVVECVYEATAQMKDHQTTRADKFSRSELS